MENPFVEEDAVDEPVTVIEEVTVIDPEPSCADVPAAPDPDPAAPEPEPVIEMQAADADCGTCSACKDKVRFGGTGKAKKGCIMRANVKTTLAERDARARPVGGSCGLGGSC